MPKAIGPAESSPSGKPPSKISSSHAALLLMELMSKGLADSVRVAGDTVPEADRQATDRLLGVLYHVAGAGELDPYNPDLRASKAQESKEQPGKRRTWQPPAPEDPKQLPSTVVADRTSVVYPAEMPEDDRGASLEIPAERHPGFMGRLAAAATSTMPVWEATGEPPSPEAIQRATERRHVGAAWHHRKGPSAGSPTQRTQPVEQPVDPPTVALEPVQTEPGTGESPTEVIEPVAGVNEPTLKISPLRGNTNSSDAGLVRGIIVEPPTLIIE